MTRKTRPTRRRFVGLAAATGAALVAGCGGPGEDEPDPVNDTEEPSDGPVLDPNTSEDNDTEGHGHQPSAEDDEPGAGADTNETDQGEQGADEGVGDQDDVDDGDDDEAEGS